MQNGILPGPFRIDFTASWHIDASERGKSPKWRVKMSRPKSNYLFLIYRVDRHAYGNFHQQNVTFLVDYQLWKLTRSETAHVN